MSLRQSVARVLVVALAALAISMLVGQLLGQPVLISYVETGSMAPTLEPGDGFIAIPAIVAGDIEEGDVITWDAENLNGGGLVTHRVVGESQQGFITRGDANPFTDQASAENEPPVREEQVLAKALQINGQLVVLPNIGLVVIGSQTAMTSLQQQLARITGTGAVLGTQGLSYIIFVLGAAAYIASIVRGQGRRGREVRTRERDTGVIDVRLIVAALAAIMVVLVTMSMTIAGGTQMYGVISSETDQPGPRVIERGTSEQATYIVPSNGVLPVQVFLTPEGEGIDVTPRELYVPSGEQLTATVTLTAPSSTGYYRFFLVEHRYLALLPRSTIRALYTIHPWMPIIAIDTLLTIGFLGIGFGLLGTNKTRIRSRKSAISTTDRLRQWLGL